MMSWQKQLTSRCAGSYLYNGAIECKLLHFVADPARIFKNAWRSDKEVDDSSAAGQQAAPATLSEGSAMFANRLRKNTQHFGKWARRNGIYCYRVYDSDIPEYAVAIDLYGQWAYVQEYEPPKTVDSEKRAERLQDVRAVLPEALAMDARDVFFSRAQAAEGSSQYHKMNDAGAFHDVREGRYKFLVNFTDYLDAGLFLDIGLPGADRGVCSGAAFFKPLCLYRHCHSLCCWWRRCLNHLCGQLKDVYFLGAEESSAEWIWREHAYV